MLWKLLKRCCGARGVVRADYDDSCVVHRALCLLRVLTGWKGMALAVCIIGALALYGFNRVFSNPFEFLCIVCLWFGAYPASSCIDIVCSTYFGLQFSFSVLLWCPLATCACSNGRIATSNVGKRRSCSTRTDHHHEVGAHGALALGRQRLQGRPVATEEARVSVGGCAGFGPHESEIDRCGCTALTSTELRQIVIKLPTCHSWICISIRVYDMHTT